MSNLNSPMNIASQPDKTISVVTKSVIPIREFLAQKLSELGVHFELQHFRYLNNNALSQLVKQHAQIEKMVRCLVDAYENADQQLAELEQLKVYNACNDEYMIKNYKTLIPLTKTLSSLSVTLNEGEYPLEVHRCFRKLHQNMSILSHNLHNFKSVDEQFLKKKEEYLNQQMSLLQICTVSNKQKNISKTNISSHKKHQTESTDRQTVEQLRCQIANLQLQLKSNNDEFSDQVQKYNSILYEQQQELRRCSQQFLYFQNKIAELESINSILKQNQIKDQLMIDNMTKKLRLHEKEKGYLSPNRQRIMSPNLTIQSSRRMEFYPGLKGQEYRLH